MVLAMVPAIVSTMLSATGRRAALCLRWCHKSLTKLNFNDSLNALRNAFCKSPHLLLYGLAALTTHRRKVKTRLKLTPYAEFSNPEETNFIHFDLECPAMFCCLRQADYCCVAIRHVLRILDGAVFLLCMSSSHVGSCGLCLSPLLAVKIPIQLVQFPYSSSSGLVVHKILYPYVNW